MLIFFLLQLKLFILYDRMFHELFQSQTKYNLKKDKRQNLIKWSVLVEN